MLDGLQSSYLDCSSGMCYIDVRDHIAITNSLFHDYRDFFSDVNLAIEILGREDVGNNTLIFIAGVGSAAFTVIPYAANLFVASRIKEIIKNNVAAKAWFQYHTPVFTILVVICGGCHAALSIVSSNVFGLKILSCGLTQYELKQMGKLKVIGTVIIENIPQLICQVLYSFALGGKVTMGVQLAFVASALSILATTLSYLIERDTTDTMVVYYYLLTQCSLRNNSSVQKDLASLEKQLSTTNRKGEILDDLEDVPNETTAISPANKTTVMSLPEDEKQNLINNRGRTLALAENIAGVFVMPVKNIEVGHSMITKYGITTHVVHFVYTADLEAMEEELLNENNANQVNVTPRFFISQLYASLLDDINQVFRNHFGLNNDFEVQFRYKLGVKKRTLTQILDEDEQNEQKWDVDNEVKERLYSSVWYLR